MMWTRHLLTAAAFAWIAGSAPICADEIAALREAVAQTVRADSAAVRALPEDARKEIEAIVARATALLDEAAADAAKAEEFAKEASDAGRRIKVAREALDALPDAGEAPRFPALKPDADASALAVALAAEKAEAESLEADLRTLRRRYDTASELLQNADGSAPDSPTPAISPEIPSAAPSDPKGRARGLLREAETARARAASDLARRERETAVPRLQALEAELQLAEAKALVARRRVAALEERRDAAAKGEADAKRALAENTLKNAAAMDPALSAVAEETAALAADLVRVRDRIAEVAAARRAGEEEAAKLRSEQDPLRANATRRVMPPDVLLDAFQRLPDAAKFRGIARWTSDALAEDRVKSFRVTERLRAVRNLPEEARHLAGEGRPDAVRSAERLLAQRRDVLRELDAAYGLLIREYGGAIAVAEDLRRLTVESRALIERALFWMQASPPITRLDAREWWQGATWVLGPKAWKHAVESLRAAAAAPLVPTAFALSALGALLLRRKAAATIVSAAAHLKGSTTDRMGETWATVAATAVLAAPIPLGIGAAVAALGMGTSGWASGLAAGAKAIFPALGLVCFLREACREDGLGPAHFRWSARSSRKLRAFASTILFYAVPAGLLVRMTLENQEAFRYQNDFGRMLFLATAVIWSIALARLLRVKDGVFSEILRHNRERWWARCAPLWSAVLAGIPLAVGGVAAAGYLFAALALHGRFLATVILALAAVFAHALLGRWFACRARQIARAEAAERARERGIETGPRAEVPEVGEKEEAIEAVENQVQVLLNFGLTIVLALGTWGIWKAFIPFLSTGGWPWAGAVEALAILVAAVIVVKNLPGVLEVAFLRHLDLQPGTRYAAITLGRYALIAAGIGLAWGSAGFDGSRLGWIFAALSVGLGFGLQEVVANFVCGIILLFERPVRVGDIVTVGEVTGVVSRIQIRATTITDWDRKEFIVPNKEFITGRLLNWTLSNTVSRITVPVGVAYGSDPERVRHILLEAAKSHPKVLRDPAPMVAFDKFGESSLDFLLRFFVANVDDRVGTQTDVMVAVIKRLAEEGIEIPFPHRRVIVEKSDA